MYLQFNIFFCRVMGPVAAVERVQCELWRGGEGASARVFAALRCRRDEVHRHGEGTVHLLTGGLCWSVSSSLIFLFSSFSVTIALIFHKIHFKSSCLVFFHSSACTFSVPLPCACRSCALRWQCGGGGWYLPLPGCDSGYYCGDCVEKALQNPSVQLCPQRLHAFSWRTQALR